MSMSFTNLGRINQFCPLECLNAVETNNKVKENFAVVITELDAVSGDEKILDSIQHLWNSAKFRAFTSTSANFLHKSDMIKMSLPNLEIKSSEEKCTAQNENHKSSHDWETIFSKPYQNEITLCMEALSKKIIDRTCEVSVIIVISYPTLPLFKLFNYLQSMYAIEEKLNNLNQPVRVSGIFGHSYVCILPKGDTEMSVTTGYEGEWCGIIPFGKPVKVTTAGLVWNLTEDILEFGVLVSTSNRLDKSGKVSISTEKPIVWTMDICV